MSKDTGGPAFPCEWDYIDSNRQMANGMTMRDYFAAKALQGLIAASKGDLRHHYGAYDAYAYADAMLKARAE